MLPNTLFHFTHNDRYSINLQKNLVELDLPRGFGPRVRDDIYAGPASVKLKEFSFYYFEIGIRISKLMRDFNLVGILKMAFCGERYKILTSRALSRLVHYSIINVLCNCDLFAQLAR